MSKTENDGWLDAILACVGVGCVLTLIMVGWLYVYNQGVKKHNTIGGEWWCSGHIDADRLYYSNKEVYDQICSQHGVTETVFRQANLRAGYGAWLPAKTLWFDPNYTGD